MAVIAPSPSIVTLPKKRLPGGHPRSWYETHNRQLKAMRLAIALLHAGAYRPEQATNRRIRTAATRIGVRTPSAATCRVVRTLIDAASG